MTIIRDINGNRLKKSLGHYVGNAHNTGHYHIDSTGLWCIDYCDDKGNAFWAAIRPASPKERSAIQLAKRIGTPRP